ncbi:MAG: response regulator transcription factor [Bacilli bacterium]|nr:response regulator transcription factor [Bacilli bacterium]
MIRVAIVEDNEQERDELIGMLNAYQEKNNTHFSMDIFSDGFAFLDAKKLNYDIIFMDIMMPGINGMDASRQLRKIDPEALLIFTTSLAQYAIEGYEVDALDFIVKPIDETKLSQVLERASERLNHKKRQEVILHIQSSIFVRIAIDDIIYIQAEEHMLTYVTVKERYEVWNSLTSAYSALPNAQFFRLSRSVVINLAFVKGLSKDNVVMKDGTVFPLPRGGKRQFIQAMDGYFNL